MKLKDLRNEIKVMDIAPLMARAKALNIEMDDLVLDKNINRIKDLKSISRKRKELARVLTSMNQKKLIASLEPKAAITDEKSEVKSQSKTEKTEKGGNK